MNRARSTAIGGACLALSLAVLFIAAPGRAQDAAPSPAPAPEPVKPWGPRLEFVGLPGCVDETDFRNAVAAVFDGVDPFDPASPRVLRVSFAKVAGGYRATLVYTLASGETWPPEPIGPGHCFAVIQSAAHTSRWRIGARPKAPPSPPPPPPEPPKPPPDPVASQAPRVAPASFAQLRSTPPPKQPPPMDLTITLSTALLLTAGLTDNVGPALQIAGGLRYNWFSLDLEVRGVFPGTVWAREAVDPTRPTRPVAFDLSQLSAQLVPCVRFATYLAGCGVLGAYTHITQDYAGTVVHPSGIVGPRFGAEVPINDRFAVFGFAEALFYPYGIEQLYRTPSAPDKADDRNVLWRSSPVAGFFAIGVLAKFR